MANSIYRSDNYIIVEKDGNVYEYAIIYTGYTRNTEGGTDKFEIIESATSARLSGRSQILVSEIDAGEWLDSPTGDPFTTATLTTFLRQNTANFSKGGASTFAELTDVPPYLGNALKGLRINAAENALEAYVATDLNQWLMSNVAFVDKASGSNTNGVVGDGNKPFRDIYFALTQSDLVVLLPGTYTETVTITADNKHVHAMEGVTFTSGGFRPNGAGVNLFSLTGSAIFKGFSQCLRVYNTDANVYFECDYIDDVRIVCWIEGNLNAPKVNFKANWVTCNAFNGGGYCVRLLGGAEIRMNIAHYFHGQHTPFHVRNGTSGKLLVNCPEIKVVPNYTSNYGNAAKSIVWCDAANGAYIEINGDLINEHNVYTFGRGCIEINNWSGTPSTITVNGDLKAEFQMCIFSQYRSAFGNIIINGDLESGRNPVFDELTGWGSPANQHWTFNNSIIQAEYQFIVGRGKTYYFKNMSMLIREDGTGIAGAGKLFLGLEPGSPASQSYLYLYNCVLQSKDTTLETFNFSANFNVGTVNTYSNLPIGTGVVDAWGGFASIASLEVPQNT